MDSSAFEIKSYKFFLDLSRRLQTTTDYHELYTHIVRAVLAGTRYKNAWLFVIDPNAENEALLVSGQGEDAKLAETNYQRLNFSSDPILREVAEGRQPVIVADARVDPRTNKEIVANLGNISIVNIPIILTGDFLGALGMGSFRDEGVMLPDQNELEFVTLLAAQVAPVIVRILEKEMQDKFEKQLRQVSEVKNQFLSSMSHELRTPLNAILGFAQLIKMGGQSPRQITQDAEEIVLAGQHLLNLVNEVLDLGEIERGQLWIDMEIVNIKALVADCLSRMKGMFEQDELLIHNSLAERGDMYVRADTTRLQHVIDNLLSNAVKFNKPGGVVLIHAEQDGENIQLNIEDKGIGIPETMQDKVFSPFEKVEQAEFVSGSGISLALSHQIVKLMGGEMGVSSKAGQGSTFWIRLRACDPGA